MKVTAEDGIGGDVGRAELADGAVAGGVKHDFVLFGHALDGGRDDGFELVQDEARVAGGALVFSLAGGAADRAAIADTVLEVVVNRALRDGLAGGGDSVTETADVVVLLVHGLAKETLTR